MQLHFCLSLQTVACYYNYSELNLYGFNQQKLMKLIQEGFDVNALDVVSGDALIHVIMKKKNSKDKFDLLIALLLHSEVNANCQNLQQMTALQMAKVNYCVPIGD